MKIEFSRQIFEKYPNIEFHRNPSSGCFLVLCGQTNRHDGANSHFQPAKKEHGPRREG